MLEVVYSASTCTTPTEKQPCKSIMLKFLVSDGQLIEASNITFRFRQGSVLDGQRPVSYSTLQQKCWFSTPLLIHSRLEQGLGYLVAISQYDKIRRILRQTLVFCAPSESEWPGRLVEGAE